MEYQHLTTPAIHFGFFGRLIVVAFCGFVSLDAYTQIVDDADGLLQSRLQAHVEFLADDLLRGRQTGSDGHNIAAAYVASQFLQLGLRPAGDNGGFFQQVPLRSAILVPGSAKMTIAYGGSETKLVFVDEFFMRPDLGRKQSELTAGMVFVGYGIDAPVLDYNDFEGLDVDGKVVVSLTGQPENFPSEEGAHFASSTEKARAAARHGAVGLITIFTPRATDLYPWERRKSSLGMPSMGWLNKEQQPNATIEQLRAEVEINHAAAAVLFEGTGVELSALLEKDLKGVPLNGFKLNGTVALRQQSEHETISSPNVVAVLPGSDPLLRDEYVVYIAHLDHIGELRADRANPQADLINNGALDNASGVSVMIETARLLARGKPPRRSILFVAVTAEEKGLVGSEYFATNPTVPVASMVAAINLDMPVLLYEFADVIAFGAEHSSLGLSVRQAADSYGVRLTPDPFPDENIFVRSDHYRFVQQGIPSVYLVTGVSALDGSTDKQAVLEAYLADHYHKPGDDLNLPIHYGAAARFTRINVKIGEIIANEATRPVWHEGDFFGRTFAK